MQTFGSLKCNCRSRFAGAAKLAGLLLAGLLPLAAEAAAPPNDNWANAQVITGDFGTIIGSNLGATRETGEPSHAGLGPTASIWYQWTASSDAPVEFDTFNSAIDTVLAVYVGTNLVNLSMVVANDDINTTNPENATRSGANVNTYFGPSGVKFNAKRGTTYYIAVDGTHKNKSPLPNPPQGSITLSWAYNPSGVFRLTRTAYSFSETESDNPPNGSVGESQQGARITVTRLFGSAGRALVYFDLTDGPATFLNGIMTARAAIAGQDYDYPNTNVLIFDHNEMSKSFIVPLRDDNNIFVNPPPLAQGRNPGRLGICDYDRVFTCSLTNVVLDASEDPTLIAPPRFDTTKSSSPVTIMDFDSDPLYLLVGGPFGGPCIGSNDTVCLERTVFRVKQDVGVAHILVYRVPGFFSTGNQNEIHFIIDDASRFPSRFNDNQFDLQAGSDYAAPNFPPTFQSGPPSPYADYGDTNGPANFGHTWTGWGTITWGANDYFAKSIDIPIVNGPDPHFNKDIIIYLFQIAGHTQDLDFGNISQATVSILYDDYPAGALDDTHNKDFDISTDPPRISLPGTDNTVYSLVVQSNDNKTVIAGTFSAFDSFPRYGIARLNADGTCDQTFDPQQGVPVKDPINPSFISTLAMEASGKFIIGGNFPSYNSVPRYNIARVNTDGSLDTTFNPGLGANGTVWTVAPLTNGQVLIGGDFLTVNGLPRPHIARLNADGSVDPSFAPGTNGPNGTVNAIAPAPDGTIYIGGDFTSIGGLSRLSVAQLSTNGLVLTNFTPVAGVNGPVFALALQPADGKLLVGGSFSSVEFRNRNNICRYNADGSLDVTFSPGAGADDSVYNITLQGDGGIFIAGLFSSVNETRRIGLARLFPSGEVDTGFLDTAFNQFAGLHKPLFDPYVNPKDFLYSTALQPDGNLMIGGSFRYVGGGRFSSEVLTNSPGGGRNGGGIDQLATVRASYRNRANVARLLGGTTIGPGSMSLVSTNYSISENQSFLFVKAMRSNGSLGAIESTFNLPPRAGSNTIGIAQSGSDYIFNRVNPRFATAWRSFAPDGARELVDGIIGTNNISTDPTGDSIQSGLDDIVVSVPNIPGYQGDRRALFQLDNPSYSDIFYLGGENIPLASALGQTESAILTIQETFTSPGVLGFSSPTFTVNENGTNAVINIIRTNGSVGPVTVRFATTNGTAITGIDYTGTTNTVLLRDGQVSTNVFIPIINNSVIAPDKTVNLYLVNPGNGATIGALSNAVLTIVNDNFLPGHLNFDSVSYSTNELAPAMLFTVTRLGGNVGVLDVQYATSNLTAVAGVNYTTTVGTNHWDSGDNTSRTIAVPLSHDGLATANLQFSMTLFNPSVAGALGPNFTATATILNVDFLGKLQFSAPSYVVNENGGYATITVIRGGGSAQTISANFTTADGPFTQKFINYIPTNGTLIFGPGVVSKSFTVPVKNDLTQDPVNNFYFAVQLTNPPSAGNVIGSPSFDLVNIVDAYSFNQPAGQVDTAFNPDLFFNDDVYTVALQPSGEILAGGNFNNVLGQPVNRLVRLKTDGSFDTSFQVNLLGGANDAVRSVISQTDTRIVVGGAFTTFDGVARNYLARLNYDGNIDNGFNPGSGASGTVFALAETFAGAARKLYVGGAFTTFNGVQLPGVVRLNDDGTVDPGFNTGQGANGIVYAVAVYPTNSAHAGQVVIGGDFTSVNGLPRTRIARLNADGSLDPDFDPLGLGVDNTIRAIVLNTDGSVVIGGAFTNVNGVAVNRIARLKSTDGTLDTTFTVGPGANDLVYALALQPDNRIVVGGAFTRASGVTRNRLTRLMPNGTLDPTINFGAGADNYVGTIAIQPDGKLVIGGGFTQFAGLSRPHLARLYGGSVVGSGAFRFDSATYVTDETSTNVLVTVLRTGGTSGPQSDGSGHVTVELRTSDGTAIAGINYSNVDAVLDFPAGETVQSVLIPVRDDLQVTPDLTVNLALINPTPPSALGDQPTAVITILNDESAVSFDRQNYSRAEDAVDAAATMTLVRIGSTRNPATVQFMTTTNGTAVPNVNFIPVTNLVTFLPSQTTQTVTVTLKHDPAAQGDTTVTMELNNSIGALLLAPSSATLTILDVEQAPGNFTFSSTNYLVGEGDGGALITILRTNGHAGVVSVGFSTVPGTATPGLKYISTNGVLNFGDGETVKSFVVPILEETNVEGNENLFVQLSNPTGNAGITGVNPVALTILDDDIGVSFATNSFLNAVYVVSETNASVTVDVFRLNTTNGTTQVSYSTSNATAIAGTDYSATSGTLTFSPGESRSSISIPILRDPLVTGDRTFTLNLSHAVNVSNPSQTVQLANPTTAFVVINDVDTGLSFYDTNSPAVPMAQYGVLKTGTNITITVLRTNATTGPISVTYVTSDGTGDDGAVSGVHYTGVSGSLIFTNGQLSNSFTVPIANNAGIQGNRKFTAALVNPTNLAGTIAPQLLLPSTATVTITDNTAGLSFSSPTYDVNQNGGAAVITVVRSGFVDSMVSVDYATAGGTASSAQGGDYDATSGTLTFTNGQTTTNFSVSVHNTTQVKPDLTVGLKLLNPSPAITTITVPPPAATLTIHNINGSIVIPAGVALLSESILPPDGVIEPGETVTLLLALRNAGGTNTANLVATLTNSPGLTALSPLSANYGVLVNDGPSVSRPFSFTATGTNGQRIVATLLLSDNGHAVGTNGTAGFTFTLGTNSSSFTNSARIDINDFAPASPYPSTITVTNIDGLVSKATVNFYNVNHTSPSDIDALLSAPGSTNSVLLMANAGGGDTISMVNLTFDDAAANLLPQNDLITNGTYRPTAYFPVSFFAAPAPPPPLGGHYPTPLSSFNGSNPVGDWSLFIIDDSQGDAGVISNGWSLNLTFVNPVPLNADLGLAATSFPNPVVQGSNVTYTLTVTNCGPASNATGVVVTDVLPSAAAYLANLTQVSQGSVTTNGVGGLTWNVGTLGTSGAASMHFSVTVSPATLGAITNSATVTTATTDLNPANDTAVAVTAVVGPSADLVLSLVGTPDPILLGGTIKYSINVSNAGPATATAVAVTDTLPPNSLVVSNWPANATLVGNVLTFPSVGDVLNNGSVNLFVYVKPLVAGLIANTASCASPTTDPHKISNSATVKTVVEQMLFAQAGNFLSISWPVDVGNFQLQSTTSLKPPVVWVNVTTPAPLVAGGTNTVTMPIGTGTKFFRLQGLGP